jgi:hypothetical protein
VLGTAFMFAKVRVGCEVSIAAKAFELHDTLYTKEVFKYFWIIYIKIFNTYGFDESF